MKTLKIAFPFPQSQKHVCDPPLVNDRLFSTVFFRKNNGLNNTLWKLLISFQCAKLFYTVVHAVRNYLTFNYSIYCSDIPQHCKLDARRDAHFFLSVTSAAFCDSHDDDYFSQQMTMRHLFSFCLSLMELQPQDMSIKICHTLHS